MNQKKKIENYQQIAMGTGLRYDEVGGLFHGERDGFDFIVYAPDARYPYMMVLHTAAKSADGSTFDKQLQRHSCVQTVTAPAVICAVRM